MRESRATLNLLVVIALAGVGPWLADAATGILWGGQPHELTQLHEALEAMGACIALGVAMLLLLRARHEPVEPHIVWVVAGLVVMGLVDAIHAMSPLGVAWAWLRHGSTLAGGLLFGAVWLAPPAFAVRRPRAFTLILAGLAVVGASAVCRWADWLPAPFLSDGYSSLPKLVNFLGGLGFVAAAVFFSRRYLREPTAEHLVLTSLSLLFGTTGLLFAFSRVWAIDWWLWHFFRLLAYGVLIVVAYEVVAQLYLRIRKAKAELELRIIERTAELQLANGSLEDSRRSAVVLMEEAVAARRQAEQMTVELRREVTDREESQAQVRSQNAILEGINRVLRAALTSENEEELGQVCLSVAEEVTGSKFGLVGEVNEQTGRLDDIAISDPGWEACRLKKAEGGRRVIPAGFKLHGIYGRVILDGKAFYTNDPKSHPDSVGIPAEHPPLTAFLGAPLTRDGKTVGLIAVANREGGYRDEDRAALEALTEPVMQALMRWRAEEALRKAREELEDRVVRRTAELSQTMEALSTERQRFNDVLDMMPAYVILLSPDYQVPFANRFFKERFGAAKGRRCYEYLFNRTEPCENCESYKCLKSQKPHHWEWIGPDGRNYDIFDFPFKDNDGSPLIMEMGIDITEARRSERELRLAHQQLASRATQLRALAGELTLTEQRERRRLAKVLHDHIQQLLVGAKFRVAILSRNADSLVQQATDEIEGLLDEAIKSSRLLTAELSPPILLEGGLGPGLEWLARWMADKHGLRVDLSIEDGIAQPSEDVRVLLFESVRELLFNSVKHARVRSASVDLRQIEGKEIQVTISDSGAGFDPTRLKRPGEQGGGFGLFSIRERLDLFGGSLQIFSAPGEGSRFILSCPLDQAVAPKPLDVKVTPTPDIDKSQTAVGANIRILLADDHAVMREGLARLLGAEPSMEVVGEAADGEMAVQLARRLRPDVILMDLSMPKLSGVDATRLITSEMPDIKVIGLSMFDESERAQTMFAAGAAAYVTKSAPSENMLAAILSCVGRFPARDTRAREVTEAPADARPADRPRRRSSKTRTVESR